jgi:hypothetical protein
MEMGWFNHTLNGCNALFKLCKGSTRILKHADGALGVSIVLQLPVDKLRKTDVLHRQIVARMVIHGRNVRKIGNRDGGETASCQKRGFRRAHHVVSRQLIGEPSYEKLLVWMDTLC